MPNSQQVVMSERIAWCHGALFVEYLLGAKQCRGNLHYGAL